MRKRKRIREDDIKFSIALRIGFIESGPPLSTILGNYGVNSVKFTKDLIEYIQGIPPFVVIVVEVIIASDKTYKINVCEPSLGQIIRIASYKTKFIDYVSGGKKEIDVVVIKLLDLLKICMLKFGNCDNNSLLMIYGCVHSTGVYIVDEE